MTENNDYSEKLITQRKEAVEKEREIISQISHRRSALGVAECIGIHIAIAVAIILALYLVVEWALFAVLWVFGLSFLHEYIHWFVEIVDIYVAALIVLFCIFFSVSDSIDQVRDLEAQLVRQRTTIRGIDNAEAKLKTRSRPQLSRANSVAMRDSELVSIEADTYKRLSVTLQTILGVFIFWMTIASAVREFVIFQGWFYRDFLSIWDMLKYEIHNAILTIGITIPNYSTLIDSIVLFSICIRAAFIISSRMSNFFPLTSFIYISITALIVHFLLNVIRSENFEIGSLFFSIQFSFIFFSAAISIFALLSVGADFLSINMKSKEVPIMPVDWSREYILWLFVSIVVAICGLYFCIETANIVK